MNMNFKRCGVVATLAIIAGSGYFLGGSFLTNSAEASEGLVEEKKVIGLSHKDYSFGYWKNGFRKHKDNKSEDILAIETGHFGLKLNMAQLDQAEFGLINDELDYEGALAAKSSRMDQLEDSELHIELEKNGKVFRAVSCRAAEARAAGERFHNTRLWESARYLQHFDIQGLVFKSADGESLVTDSLLRIIAWPDSLSLTAEVAPAITYKNGPEIGVDGKGQCVIDAPLVIPHEAGLENEKFSDVL